MYGNGTSIVESNCGVSCFVSSQGYLCGGGYEHYQWLLRMPARLPKHLNQNANLNHLDSFRRKIVNARKALQTYTRHSPTEGVRVNGSLRLGCLGCKRELPSTSHGSRSRSCDCDYKQSLFREGPPRLRNWTSKRLRWEPLGLCRRFRHSPLPGLFHGPP